MTSALKERSPFENTPPEVEIVSADCSSCGALRSAWFAQNLASLILSKRSGWRRSHTSHINIGCHLNEAAERLASFARPARATHDRPPHSNAHIIQYSRAVAVRRPSARSPEIDTLTRLVRGLRIAPKKPKIYTAKFRGGNS